MPSLTTITALISAIPGVLALFGSLIWLGRLSSRMNTVENELRALKDIKTETAVIAERTRSTDEQVKAQSASLVRITEHLLDEGRSFAREIIRRDARDRREGRPTA